LSQSETDVQTAFSNFQRIRYQKTTAIAKNARRFARSLFDNDPDACHHRNQQQKEVDEQLAVQGIAKGWGQDLPSK